MADYLGADVVTIMERVVESPAYAQFLSRVYEATMAEQEARAELAPQVKLRR